MFVVTFYSFKGGVGRTMALINVAFDLAARGKRVLIVDFDLEAPGISGYELCEPALQRGGIVDYVTSFLETGEAPSVRDYITECHSPEGRSLWVMSAGRRDRLYGAKLASLDWQKLYRERDGYLLLEDLKQQWKEFQDPPIDYVLVDSRTGHTDVQGICTRQLPDAVALMFYPNVQNIDGLSSVVEEIRVDGGEQEDEKRLIFVPSNVPDIDDEHEILAKRLETAAKKLGYDDPDALIHHYNSLDLVNQEIFVLSRPKSKLAKEYRQLAAEIQKANPEDKEGVIASLRALRAQLRDGSDRAGSVRRRRSRAKTTPDQVISGALAKHEKDPEVARMLASIFSEMGNLEGEITALTNVIESNQGRLSARRVRATRLVRADRFADASADIEYILSSDSATFTDARFAVDLLVDLKEEWVGLVGRSGIIDRLQDHDVIELSEYFLVDDAGAELALRVINKIEAARSNDTPESSKVLALIRLRRFVEAMAYISERVDIQAADDIAIIFNYAMADWGDKGEPSRSLFERVIKLDQGLEDANRHQCLALSFAVIGDYEAARERIRKSRSKLGYGRVFSCWRYRRVHTHEMRADLDALRSCIDGSPLAPPVLDTPRT